MSPHQFDCYSNMHMLLAAMSLHGRNQKAHNQQDGGGTADNKKAAHYDLR
jgi:hypothetical protein